MNTWTTLLFNCSTWCMYMYMYVTCSQIVWLSNLTCQSWASSHFDDRLWYLRQVGAVDTVAIVLTQRLTTDFLLLLDVHRSNCLNPWHIKSKLGQHMWVCSQIDGCILSVLQENYARPNLTKQAENALYTAAVVSYTCIYLEWGQGIRPEWNWDHHFLTGTSWQWMWAVSFPCIWLPWSPADPPACAWGALSA